MSLPQKPSTLRDQRCPRNVEAVTNNLRIIDFLEGMDSLGESRVFGSDDPSAWLTSLGYGFLEITSAGDYLEDHDAVLGTYSFAIAKR